MNHDHATDEIRETAALYVLGAMEAGEAALVREHLASGCAVCLQQVDHFTAVMESFASTETPVAPPPSLRDRVLAVTRSAPIDGAATTKPASLRAMLPPELMRGEREPWTERSPGVRSHVLHIDATSGRVTSLFRLDAGAVVPPHRHLGIEELFMIDGDCHVEPGRVIHAGDYYRAEPGSMHASTFSERGATFLTVALNRYATDA